MGWQVEPPPTTLAVVPGLTVPTTPVQIATPGFGSLTATATFPANITAGDSVICAVSGIPPPTVAPASGPDTYTQDSNLGAWTGTTHGFFYHVSNSAGGYNSITVTTGSGNAAIYAYEVQGTTIFGSATTATGTVGAFTDNYTPAVAAEFLVAFSAQAGTSASLSTPPAAPWTNEPIQNGQMVSSFQLVAATTTVTYSGQWTGIANTLAGVGGYKLTNPGEPTPVNQCLLYYFGGQLFALGTSGVPVVLAVT